MKNFTRNDILKIIAMVTMLIDHLGVLYFPELRILRTIGRIAYPIFAYQIALGYKNTSNRGKYRWKLFIFGVVSQIPYMLLNKTLEPEYYVFNVLLLFWFATFVLQSFEKSKQYFNSSENKLNILWGTLFSLLTLFLVLLPELIKIKYNDFGLSYGTYGLMMILMFYIAGQNPFKIIFGFLAVSFIGAILYGVYVIYYYYDYTYLETWSHFSLVWENMVTYKDGLRTLEGYFFQARSMMAVPIIIGLEYLKPRLRINKNIAYYFYPVHITLLILFRLILGISFE